MYQYVWDAETGGLLLTTELSKFSKEPRPVYYEELDILGFDQYWDYPKDDHAPLMWAEANNYIYMGRTVARTKGGSLYTRPELEILDSPEPDGNPLQFVDVEAMCKKNAKLMEALSQDAIKGIYNTYEEYAPKIDIFYVAFSGGKDSVVVLDLVERALPKESFKILFGDTLMEFSDTYSLIDRVKAASKNSGMDFLIAKSTLSPRDTWKLFGPPCTVTRWCCSVHKTAPQILLLRELLQKPKFTGMGFVGIRADESISRSKYDFITYEGKHKGQYSCNAILGWSSAEVFLYIFTRKLLLNEAYKKGNRRVGCLICPRASERNDFMNHSCYAEQAEPLVNLIRNAYSSTFSDSDRLEDFIKNGGWKARKNGRDIDIPVNYTEKFQKNEGTVIRVKSPRTDWKEWIKTIGILTTEFSPHTINFQGEMLQFEVIPSDLGFEIRVDVQTSNFHPNFVKLLKNVFRKSACCVGCKVCQADCPYGCISFAAGSVNISDRCHHCAQCHKVDKGCLIYKSLEQPKGGILMADKSMSLNSFSHHAPKPDWISQYFTFKSEFDEKHSLGSQMYSFFKRFLRDAELLDENGFSAVAEIIDRIGYMSNEAWGIIYTNLCSNPQIFWYVNGVDFGRDYSKGMLASLMVEAGAKESWTNDIFSSLVRFTELPMGELGFGKTDKVKNRAVSIHRNAWENPIPEIILYSLYKFSEACGNIKQFSLGSLLDDSIERDGVSPTRIFGLDRDMMVRILNGLSMNYPDFINASFTLGLDSITLRDDKTSADVLTLF